MQDKNHKEAVAQIRKEVGSKIKRIRTEELEYSQDKLGQNTPHLEGNNLQVRIAAIERGNGSAGAIYALMRYLYSEGVNINFLFGEEESMMRINKQVSLYPENISDHLKDVIVTGSSALTLIEEIVTNTKRVQEYVEQTVEMADGQTEGEGSN